MICEKPVSVEATFPADYSNTAVAGKTAKFEITAHHVMVPAEYNDEFVATYFEAYGVSTMAEFDAYMNRNFVLNATIEAIMEAEAFKVHKYPELELNAKVDEQCAYDDSTYQSYGFTLEEVLADMNERDANDKNREVAPAVAAPDAVHLDNSAMTLDETYEAAMKIITEKAGDKLPKAEKKTGNKRSMSGFYRFMWHVFHGFFKFIFNTKIHGAENEPDADYGAMLVCSNHISATDPIVIGLTMRRHQACFMAKKELFKIPLFAQLIRMLGAFPVDRKKSDVAAVRHTIKILEGGGWAAMFPQGTRHPGEDPRKTSLKNGAGMICAHTGADVLPVFIKVKNNKYAFLRGNIDL